MTSLEKLEYLVKMMDGKLVRRTATARELDEVATFIVESGDTGLRFRMSSWPVTIYTRLNIVNLKKIFILKNKVGFSYYSGYLNVDYEVM